MRYILDDYGYIEEVTFGGYIKCNNQSCTEYVGTIPSGYSSLEEWSLKANIRAYKIVDGNLIYDADKDAKLEALCEKEANDNRRVTYKELENKLSNFTVEASNQAELGSILPIRSESGDVIVLLDSSSYPMERITIECKEATDDLKLYISTNNMLPNEALSGNKDGITYVVNEDKSISLGGTTENFDLSIGGSATNTEPIFILKAGETYYIGDTSGVTLNLYTNDGTDRVLFYTGTGGTITPTEDVGITHAEISYVGTIDEEVKLMISVGESREYEPCEYKIVPIDLNTYTADADSIINIEEGIITLDGNAINVIEMPSTFYENTTMYLNKNASLDIDYKKSGFNTVTRKGKGSLTLRNTADGYGSIFNFKIEGLTGGETYTLETSDGDTESEQYTINLADYTGTVDVIIEEGQTGVYQDDVLIGSLGSIYIRTYSPRTYIELLDRTNRLTCEYMLESDFSVYCTRVEKDASIKVVEDKISLEVKRASEKEGELQSAIEIEADKIKQIVASVGANGEVTAASIILAINENEESKIKISADKIDITGMTFPTIRNDDNTNYITSVYEIEGSTCLGYKSQQHRFLNDKETLMFRIVGDALEFYGQMIQMGIECPFIQIGGSGTLNLCGTVLVNGEEIGATPSDTEHNHDDRYYTEDEIDTMIGDVEAVLQTLTTGSGV